MLRSFRELRLSSFSTTKEDRASVQLNSSDNLSNVKNLEVLESRHSLVNFKLFICF